MVDRRTDMRERISSVAFLLRGRCRKSRKKKPSPALTRRRGGAFPLPCVARAASFVYCRKCRGSGAGAVAKTTFEKKHCKAAATGVRPRLALGNSTHAAKSRPCIALRRHGSTTRHAAARGEAAAGLPGQHVAGHTRRAWRRRGRPPTNTDRRRRPHRAGAGHRGVPQESLLPGRPPAALRVLGARVVRRRRHKRDRRDHHGAAVVRHQPVDAIRLSRDGAGLGVPNLHVGESQLAVSSSACSPSIHTWAGATPWRHRS